MTLPHWLRGRACLRAGAIGLHLLYSPSITPASLLAGAAVMGTTFGIPFQTYAKATGAPPRLGDVLGRYFGAVPDHLRQVAGHVTGRGGKNAPRASFSVLPLRQRRWRG